VISLISLTLSFKLMGREQTNNLSRKDTKPISSVTLDEDICNLIVGVNVTNNHIFVNNLLSNKVIINFDMFGSRMKDKIRSQRHSTEIITPECRW